MSEQRRREVVDRTARVRAVPPVRVTRPIAWRIHQIAAYGTLPGDAQPTPGPGLSDNLLAHLDLQ